MMPNQKRPKSINGTIGIQHVFQENYTVEVRYMGTRGLYLPVQDQLNRQTGGQCLERIADLYDGAHQATLESDQLHSRRSTAASYGAVAPSFLAS